MKYLPITILIIILVGSFYLFPENRYMTGFRHGSLAASIAIGVYWLFSSSGAKI
jgi:hypothetical protein